MASSLPSNLMLGLQFTTTQKAALSRFWPPRQISNQLNTLVRYQLL